MLSTNQTQYHIGILISNGFNESDVAYCLSQLRMAGLPTAVIGAINNTISSQHGLLVHPDESLNSLSKETHFRLLIIPGGRECVNNLLSSPGFHSQLEKNGRNGGYIAILRDAEPALQQTSLFTRSQTNNILCQSDQPLAAFCQQLIKVSKAN